MTSKKGLAVFYAWNLPFIVLVHASFIVCMLCALPYWLASAPRKIPLAVMRNYSFTLRRLCETIESNYELK